SCQVGPQINKGLRLAGICRNKPTCRKRTSANARHATYSAVATNCANELGSRNQWLHSFFYFEAVFVVLSMSPEACFSVVFAASLAWSVVRVGLSCWMAFPSDIGAVVTV